MVPSRKVTAGVLAGAVSVILVWAIKTYVHQDLPGEVASSITTVLTFVTSWFVPETE
jgi:preprotein translocase subunit SecD